MGPDQDGGVLEQRNLLLEVCTINVNHLDFTARPFGSDVGLQLLYIQDVTAHLVRSVHYGHPQRLVLDLHTPQCISCMQVAESPTTVSASPMYPTMRQLLGHVRLLLDLPRLQRISCIQPAGSPAMASALPASSCMGMPQSFHQVNRTVSAPSRIMAFH